MSAQKAASDELLDATNLVYLQDRARLAVVELGILGRDKAGPALALELNDDRGDAGVAGGADDDATGDFVEVGEMWRRVVQDYGDKHGGGCGREGQRVVWRGRAVMQAQWMEGPMTWGSWCLGDAEAHSWQSLGAFVIAV